MTSPLPLKVSPNWLHERLGNDDLVVVDSVPTTALGKPDKKAVRAQFWSDTARAVG